ncbi:hypothetical protein PF005_g9089 [Phytophthora fragariae]|nr:hypothetical protein PF009_g10034 [Phytophthora fragariae]KAE9028129.1 hypothetical protein PF011_g1720 [Phytophthora fragariae]KAE9117772.1 hypothetical protein PF007_g9157 [Phytophthora fragariae]KAE9135438.1 hypothetical protein PF010_g2084 [Phytophthora fragariae]KAE9146932.1 hypothetical protein PF006_g8346 [Phytophthora fragariae]
MILIVAIQNTLSQTRNEQLQKKNQAISKKGTGQQLHR